MARKGQKREKTVVVPESWLEDLRKWQDGPPKQTLKILGPALARAMGKSNPVPKSTISDFLRGQVMTESLVRGFAELSGLPVPLMQTDAGLDEEMRRWLEVGAELRRELPERFRRQLAALEEFVESAKRLRFP